MFIVVRGVNICSNVVGKERQEEGEGGGEGWGGGGGGGGVGEVGES